MRGSDRDLWSGADWGVGAPASAGPGRSGWGMWDGLRACVTPANLAMVAVVTVGWLALLGWSGAGPDGWQARLCGGLEMQPQACSAVRHRKDESRIVPHTITAGTPS